MATMSDPVRRMAALDAKTAENKGAGGPSSNVNADGRRGRLQIFASGNSMPMSQFQRSRKERSRV